MDSFLLAMDGEVVAEVLGTVVLLALLTERALSLLFEWRSLVSKFYESTLKEPIALGLSFVVVYG